MDSAVKSANIRSINDVLSKRLIIASGPLSPALDMISSKTNMG